MSDDRLERIEISLSGEIKESAEFRGELRQFIKNTDQRVNGVAEKLNLHIADQTAAHGAGVRSEINGRAMTWIAVIATLASGFLGAIGAEAHKLFSPKP